MTASLAVIVYERLSGIVVLLFFALIASFLKIGFIRQMPMLYVSLLVSLLGILVLFLAWKKVPRGFLAGLGNRCHRPWPRRLLGKLDVFHGIILDFVSHRTLSRKVFFWAALLQFNVLLHFIFIGRALGIGRIPVLDFFFAIPIMLFILSFPISINGIGVRDLFLITFFELYKVGGKVIYDASYAVSFSLLDLSFTLLLGAIGGVIYIFREK
jgi:hypothetical protein